MKNILLSLFVLLSTIFTFAQSPAPYCPVSYSNVPCNSPGPSQSPGNGVNDFINSFNTTGALQNITNNNSGCNGNPNNYIRYNCNQHYLKVQPGQVITCNVQSGIIFGQGFAVFIDWNQNNVFDIPAERVTSTVGVPLAGTFSAITFTVPAGQATGQYRMRVRCAYATAGNTIGPCQLYGFGETEDYEVFVNMDPQPIAGTVTTNATGVCPGQNVTLTLQGQNGTIQWQSAPNAGGPWTNVAGATTSPFVTPNINSNICFRAALTSCGQTVYTQPICITLGQLPTLTINNPTICEGDSTILTLNATPPGGTYLWSNGQTTQSIVVSPTTTTTYTVTYDLGGCVVNGTAIVTVNPNPQITIVGDSSICFGESTTLTANQNVNYFWNTGDFTQSITVNPTSTTTYNVTVANTNGCISTAPYTVVVNPLPIASFVNDNVCNGVATTLTSTSTVSSGSLVNYVWTEGANLIGNTSTITYQFQNAGTFPVTLAVSTDQNCVSLITQNVTVYANPVINFSTPITVGCAPFCFNLTDFTVVPNSQIVEWVWTANGQQISTVPSPNHCFTTEGVYDIGLTVTSAQGCVSTLVLDDYITVNPMPVSVFILPTDSIPLSNATMYFANQSLNASNFEWDFGDSTNSTEFSPTHTFNSIGLYCIELTAYGAAGCVDVSSQCVQVYSEFFVYIPNSFTPDGDGLNETFGVKGVGIKSVEFTIFNRWGQLIYKSNLGSFTDIHWNGLTQDNNTMAKQDVYVYQVRVIDEKSQEHIFHGRVHLIN